MMNLILASQSPRRRELLTQAGYEFTVSLVKVSEIFDESLNPREVPGYLAKVKAGAALDQHNALNTPENLILGADTLVLRGDKILGKPRDIAEAYDFLRSLSGVTHHVITGLALLRPDHGPAGAGPTIWCRSTATEVRFRELSHDEISAYVATGEPMDKAGAYAIQGGAANFVSSFSGSWSNVVGLPLETLEHGLAENGWIVGRRTPRPT